MIAIIDYGMGNIHSVKKALEVFGARCLVTGDGNDIAKCDKVVLPGVGAFDDAMQELQNYGLDTAIKKAVDSGKSFLGICLGMQLLFEASEEAAKKRGLGILKGKIKRFSVQPGLKVPHMGWNNLMKTQIDCALLNGVADNSYVYFCHSYYPAPKDKEIVSATCDYGGGFAAVVNKNNLYGTQFHPEKSQCVGTKILENFVKLC